MRFARPRRLSRTLAVVSDNHIIFDSSVLVGDEGSSMIRFFTTAAVCLLFTSVFRGQSINASLTGRVTDPSEARIVAAKIAAIGAYTSVRYETATNTSGEYYLPSILPGTYRIEVEKPGFKKLIKPNVIL